uniref:ATP synthase complex subunit 8 n=1 Tax=Typhlatya miravetensis TaxID=390490 RepID=A0A2H1DQP5_9EUCA|nr:ATP synthase F0 subunit 8 [Typhlatya miravetensis]SCN12522.1 ATP synthase F0 subunit 8 [Typhlatya miravetensis]
MPQMAPLLWLNLFIFFSFSFMLFFILNYFLTPYSKKKQTSKTKEAKKLNWKW